MSAVAALALAGALLAAGATDEAVKPLNLSRPTAGYTYYNRPGADLGAQEGDLLACVGHASSVRSVDQQMGSGGTGLLGALIGGAIADAATSGVMAASIENCMVVYGWRVVRLPDAEGKALSELSAEDLRAKLAPWVGASQAHGDVVRVWRNDAANGTVNHFSLRPGHTKKGQLSLLAMGAARTHPPAGRGAEGEKPSKPVIDPKWRRGSLKPADLAAAPPGSGIVVVSVRGMGMTRGNGLIFRRVGADPAVRPSLADHAPDEFTATGSTLGGGKTLAYVLPPGRWRIASDLNGLMELNYCLGSPSFELKAGEVLYAGALDLKAEKLQPDFAMQPVKQWLGAMPAAAAIRPASYTNGSRGACGPNSIYAIEFEGAPFEPGYALGSLAGQGDRSAAQ
jgi:hypothetical protein